MQQIHKVNLNDWQKVFRIVDECSTWLFAKGITHWRNYYTEQRIIHKIISADVFVLGEDSPVGTISLSSTPPDYYSEIDVKKFSSGAGIYITTLAVIPDFQGKGYASELLEFSGAYALQNRYKFLRLDTRDYDSRLVEFYLKRGFEIRGKLSDPADRFLLEKAL